MRLLLVCCLSVSSVFLLKKPSQAAGVVGQLVKASLGMLTSSIGVPDLSPWLLNFQSSLLLMCLGDRRGWLSRSVLAIHVGYGSGAPSSWFLPGPTLASIGTWGVSQQRENVFPSLFSFCSAFQVDEKTTLKEKNRNRNKNLCQTIMRANGVSHFHIYFHHWKMKISITVK